MSKAVITPENAEQARAELAALDAQEQQARIVAENEARAARREVIKPVADILAADTLDIDSLRTAADTLPLEERSLAGLCRSLLDCRDQAKRLIERRMADTELTPVPAET